LRGVFIAQHSGNARVNRICAKQSHNAHRATLALPVKPRVELLREFKRPVEAKPNAKRAA